MKTNVMRKFLVTGAAGFIGSFLVEKLLAMDFEVVGVDNLSNGKMENLKDSISSPNFHFFEFDVCDSKRLQELILDFSITEIWHLAANTDIITSHQSPFRDFRDCAEATVQVLEAMRITGVKKIIFASSGSVYGHLGNNLIVNESTGPLMPLSTYGAGKLASEGFIAAYANLYKIESHIFRFGNVLGSRINHGVIYDFINKINQDKSILRVLGDGTQEKNYFRVIDCLDGMWQISNVPIEIEYCRILNLGNSTLTNVLKIAKICADVVGAFEIQIEIEGNALAWPGDQPIIRLDCRLANSFGWTCSSDSDESVRLTAAELYQKSKLN
jgi:UDP-glucose 4-epimerase